MSKMFIAGVTHQSGIGSKSGNPYSMPRIAILEPFVPVDTKDLKRVGYGFVPGEMACSLEAIEQAKSLKFPNFYEVEIETVLRSGQYEPVVKAFKG